ncbi:hypothetical protein AKJ09_06113 [Labilithrix luteola]|uniref:Uncharacterized protein n=1 Tax=Labilithrix luteola TaxID=1391654 RepID=A0A0K1Q244_9BACT|nr:hypothetical protein AKJ09_06113 [Labilithrix luteola]
MPALRASHLQARFWNPALVNLVRRFARLALDLQHLVWKAITGRKTFAKPWHPRSAPIPGVFGIPPRLLARVLGP